MSSYEDLDHSHTPLGCMLKPNATAKRLDEIKDLEERIQKFADQYRGDFSERSRLDSALEKDLGDAIHSLELLKGIYKRRTEKPKK